MTSKGKVIGIINIFEPSIFHLTNGFNTRCPTINTFYNNTLNTSTYNKRIFGINHFNTSIQNVNIFGTNIFCKKNFL